MKKYIEHVKKGLVALLAVVMVVGVVPTVTVMADTTTDTITKVVELSDGTTVTLHDFIGTTTADFCIPGTQRDESKTIHLVARGSEITFSRTDFIRNEFNIITWSYEIFPLGNVFM